MCRQISKYVAPELDLYEVEVEQGYRVSLDGEASEIDGTKPEGEW